MHCKKFKGEKNIGTWNMKNMKNNPLKVDHPAIKLSDCSESQRVWITRLLPYTYF